MDNHPFIKQKKNYIQFIFNTFAVILIFMFNYKKIIGYKSETQKNFTKKCKYFG